MIQHEHLKLVSRINSIDDRLEYGVVWLLANHSRLSECAFTCLHLRTALILGRVRGREWDPYVSGVTNGTSTGLSLTRTKVLALLAQRYTTDSSISKKMKKISLFWFLLFPPSFLLLFFPSPILTDKDWWSHLHATYTWRWKYPSLLLRTSGTTPGLTVWRGCCLRQRASCLSNSSHQS